jgi:UDP-glucose 4-epimerase
MAGPKVVVTGAAGFIGSNLCRRLADSHEVVGIDKAKFGSSPGVAAATPLPCPFRQMDLSRPRDLASVVSGSEVVYHLAANADVQVGSLDPSIDLNHNLLATHALLEAMRKTDVGELVFTSTSLVYANASKRPTPENYGPLRPVSHYAASKLAAEAFISSYSATYGMKYTTFRFANIIGRDQTRMVTYDFVRRLRADPSTLVIRGSGRQRRSFLYIDDCLDGLVGLRRRADGLFNLATRTTTTIDDVARIVSHELGVHPEIRYDRTYGDVGFVGDLMEIELDPSKALAEGWKYRYESPEAVRAAAKDIIETTRARSPPAPLRAPARTRKSRP